MNLNLKNKVALVFGASGGLGGAIAEGLAKQGAKIVAAGLNQDKLNATAKRISEYDGSVMTIEWDLSNLECIDEKISEIEKRVGTVEILVNNTGGPPPTKVEGQDSIMWNDYFDSMVLSVIKITDRILPGMKKKNWGRIITSTSSGVITPIPNLGLSNSLRSALVGWSKTLANEIAPYGITANVLVPGRIATERIIYLDKQKAKRQGLTVEEVRKESTSSIPLGRYGTTEEYANVATFLASEASSYVTGSVLRVDGGMIPAI